MDHLTVLPSSRARQRPLRPRRWRPNHARVKRRNRRRSSTLSKSPGLSSTRATNRSVRPGSRRLDIEPVPDDAAAAAAEEDGKVKRQPGMYCTVCTDFCVDTHGGARSGNWVTKPGLSKQAKNAWDRHSGSNTHENAVAAKVCRAWPCP